MKKIKTDMRDFDNITAKLKTILDQHPDYAEFIHLATKYGYCSKNEQLKYSERFGGECIGEVFLQSGKQSIKTSGYVRSLLALIAKREKVRSSIEKPRKTVIKGKYYDSTTFPQYHSGMSTEQYVQAWLNIGDKPYPEALTGFEKTCNESWFQDKQARMSYFQALNTSPATEYDSSYPEVVEESVD